MARNLSVQRYFERVSSAHIPAHRFAGSSESDWRRWRQAALPAVQATCGRMPEKVPLNPELLAEWHEDGLIKQRVVFDVEKGLSATALVFRPENATGRLPAILACHGHGPFGKAAVMGCASGSEMRAHIAALNYDYGLQMAKAGYVTLAIDWRGFGERDDRRKPHFDARAGQRDLCNIHYLRATMLGTTMLGANIHDGLCAIDYLCQQPFVDPQRLGVMGLSFGGTMTTWLALMDQRLKAADVICYSDFFRVFAMSDANVCGNQINPGLFAVADLPDLQGLIAPRPLLVEIGLHDECFSVDTALACYREVEKIYLAASVKDRLELDLFPGGHQWGANKSLAFFNQHLKGAATH